MKKLVVCLGLGYLFLLVIALTSGRYDDSQNGFFYDSSLQAQKKETLEQFRREAEEYTQTLGALVSENIDRFDSVKEAFFLLPYERLRVAPGESVFGVDSPSAKEIKTHSPELFSLLKRLEDNGFSYDSVEFYKENGAIRFYVFSKVQGGISVDVMLENYPKEKSSDEWSGTMPVEGSGDWGIHWELHDMGGI